MDTLQTLDSIKYWNMWHEGLPGFIRAHYDRHPRRLRILEAGCGSQCHMDMTGLDYSLTGVDVSEEVLKRRIEKNDLDQMVVADLRTVEFGESEFDVIYCSYVLEHISGAEALLDKFFHWLRPGGLLLLLIPDRDTIKGLATRVTPFWFHVNYFKYIRRQPTAGKPGFGPFRTYLDKVVSRRGMHKYCEERGCKVIAEHGNTFDVEGDFGVFSPLYRLVLGFISLMTFHKIQSTHSDLMFVIKKNGSDDVG